MQLPVNEQIEIPIGNTTLKIQLLACSQEPPLAPQRHTLARLHRGRQTTTTLVTPEVDTRDPFSI